jgi:UDP-N-acetylmuramoyl-tripeptide--D-alanyl-D-alanine ligase
MTAAEAARIVGGSLEGSGEALLTGAEVDSRLLEPGDLFVALPGDRVDGHVFVGGALEVGAAALVKNDADLPSPHAGTAMIRVADPLRAYWTLARWEREHRGWRIVAVTGSVGKTTVKDFLVQLLHPTLPIGASAGNRNNTLGLPAQLLSQPSEVDVFVAEAGMSTAGELDTLGVILEPIELLLYTRIAPVHLEFFDDINGIVRAKAELLPYLDRGGTLVLNAADRYQDSYAGGVSANIVRYGEPATDIWIENLEDLGLLGTRFELVAQGGRAAVELALPGRHQAENLLAAAAAAIALGVGVDQAAAIAAGLEAAPHRGRVHLLPDDITLVDDSYNASPVAVERLLDLLAGTPGRRVAVLGEMLELGDLTDEAHREAGVRAAAACDLLVVVGTEAATRMADAARESGLSEVLLAEDANEATEVLRRLLRPGDVVLIKGSRGIGLDRTVDALVGLVAA